MAIADLTLGAIALLALPLQQAAALSNVNPDTKMVSADSSPNSFLGSSPSRRQLETITSEDTSNLKKYFGTGLEINLNNLPTSAEAKKIPWPGGSWATYLDGINYKWNPSRPSPAELYATAFGKDVNTIMSGASDYSGIGSQIYNPVCTTDADCKPTHLCIALKGNTKRVCIGKAYSLNYGWSEASILEKEPKCPVTYNLTTFQPMDIKGLLSQLYYHKYSTDLSIGNPYKELFPGFDQFGRSNDASYRDANPGAMHIVAANMLGRLDTCFIVDADPDVAADVHSVFGFKVLEQKAFSPSEAAKTFYGLDSYKWNADAKSIVYVNSSLSWIDMTYTDGDLVDSGRYKQFMNQTTYTYLLELDSRSQIIGGEWIKESNKFHPDTIWMKKEKVPQDFVTSYGLRYADVEMLLEKSVACSG